jgi:hypothetical protein
MRGIKHLSFEIGPRCNMSREHEWCPASVLERGYQPVGVGHIVLAIQSALDMGFDGFVGFHYYNEPLLYPERIAAVMDGVPEAKFMLWTNGTLVGDHASLVDRFDWVVRTDYDGRGNYPYAPDGRIHNGTSATSESVCCFRPRIEMPVDYTGEVRLCCQDWRGLSTFGNIAHEAFPVIAARWKACVERIAAGDNPPPCLSCTNPRVAP